MNKISVSKFKIASPIMMVIFNLVFLYFFFVGTAWINFGDFFNYSVPKSFELHGFLILLAYLSFICVLADECNVKKKEMKWLTLTSLGSMVYFFTSGPFIQPPADPLEHSRRIYSYVAHNETVMFSENHSFLTISIASLFSGFMPSSFSGRFFWMNFIHALNCFLFLFSIVYGARVYGLKGHYPLIAGLLSVLFFGTNRFSYYSYYSLAPTMLNLSFFFLWFAFTLRVSSWGKLNFNALNIIVVGCLIVPALYFNHRQEAAFYFFAIIFALVIFIFRLVRAKSLSLRLTTIFAMAVFFVLPISYLMITLTPESIPKLGGDLDEKFIVKFIGFPFFAKMAGSRVGDTLGFVGVLPVIVFVLSKPLILILSTSSIRRKTNYNLQALNLMVYFSLPGLIPFFVYFIPGNLQIWSAFVREDVFYRFVYAGLPWVSISGYIWLVNTYIWKIYREQLKVEKSFVK